tara:strand:- start:21213 stop:21890 length:678 start_codon:yes stop_codon:yes gene_type:complete
MTNPAHRTSWELIVEAANGAQSARSTFAHSYIPLIRSYLKERWRHSHLAASVDDAVQDVFVECFRQNNPLLRADGRRGGFRSFLLGIVRNVARRIEEGRGQREQANAETALAIAPAHEEDLATLFDREWAFMVMREAAELQRQRARESGKEAIARVQLLERRFGDDQPIRDIATQSGEDAPHLHRAYAKARAEFHSCLRETVAFHSVRTEVDLDAECRRLLDLLA